MLAAFERLGIVAEEIFDVVAAVLWIGQTKFAGTRDQDTAVTVEDAAPIHKAAQLLGASTLLSFSPHFSPLFHLLFHLFFTLMSADVLSFF